MAIIYKDGKPVVVSEGLPEETPPPSPELPGESNPPIDPALTRRRFMRSAFLGSLTAGLIGAAGTYVAFFWPKKVGTFGSTIKVGDLAQFPPGSVTRIAEGRFYLVHTLPEDGGGYLALYWKCAHLGCTVPWRESEDGTYGGKTYKGIFHCPCHGSEYLITGQNFAGPAPRPLDIMQVVISGSTISVNTGKITKREEAKVSDQVKA
ncbi:MAG TPA: Rieske 2Fe-2S domain-containing protein [Chloroflexia bacterium]|nr:Rieske 2Fe-2S domain-containing protein [Chloroflexia bacterium]